MKLRMKVKKRDLLFRKLEGEIEIEADTKEDIEYLAKHVEVHAG